ncbi:MAG: M23 family metallopeptidase [Candidatus Ryanbacteria bacterium]|nr:M23 family metallopeptidase [Candidatus Ryanbacteria bacterium]
MCTFTIRVLVVIFTVLFGLVGSARAIDIYTDDIASGWGNWSWASVVSVTNARHGDTGKGLYVSYTGQWSGLDLHSYGPINTHGHDALTFWIRAPVQTGVRLQVQLRHAGSVLGWADLNNFLSGETLPVAQWVKVIIPLTSLGAHNVSITDVIIMNKDPSYPAVHIDDVKIENLGINAPGTIYREGPAPGFQNWSWTQTDLFWKSGCASDPFCLMASFARYQPWSGLYLYHPYGISTGGTNLISFSVKADDGWMGLRDLQVQLRGQWIPWVATQNLGTRNLRDYLPPYTQVAANRWYEVSIPLADLGASNATVVSFVVMNSSATSGPRVYFDDVRFTNGAIYSPPDMKLPLPGGKNWYLTVESGGKEHCGRSGDPFHYPNEAYFSLDFSANTSENGGNAENDVPVLAAASGQVIEVGKIVDSGNGNYVRIDHDSPYNGTGYTTYYLHLASFATGIHPGAYLYRGQVLGVMGSSGKYSTGIHLHFQIKYNGSSSLDATATDPQSPHRRTWD